MSSRWPILTETAGRNYTGLHVANGCIGSRMVDMKSRSRLGAIAATAAALIGSALAVEAAEIPDRASGAGSEPYGPLGIFARIPKRDEFGRDQLAMFRAWNPDPIGAQEPSLDALNPQLAAVVRKMRASNPELRFVVGSGRRDRRQQQLAFAWGWSRTRFSSPQTGNAVDLWPLDLLGRVYFDRAAQNRIGEATRKAAAELGVRIRWGGNFHGFRDRDRSHFELASP
jgi:peptidoglycan L-alanyl-D-glutamate endopeptidase CwlK